MNCVNICTYLCRHIKYPSFLSDFSQPLIFLTDFRLILNYQISRKCVKRESSFSMRTCRQTWQANSGLSQFCVRTWKRCISCSGWFQSNEMTGCYIYVCIFTSTHTQKWNPSGRKILNCASNVFKGHNWRKQGRKSCEMRNCSTIKRKHIIACANLLVLNYSTAIRTTVVRPLSKISCYFRPMLQLQI